MKKNPAYKGFLIRSNLTGDIWIERGGFLISYAKSVKDAEKTIDNLIRKDNPPQISAVIYGRVLRIEAEKTQPHRCDSECKDFAHKYAHNFKPGAIMYGLSNGDILISTRKLVIR